MVIAPQNNMPATSTISTVGTSFCIKSSTQHMPASCSTFPRAAKHPNIIYKVILFHNKNCKKPPFENRNKEELTGFIPTLYQFGCQRSQFIGKQIKGG